MIRYSSGEKMSLKYDLKGALNTTNRNAPAAPWCGNCIVLGGITAV